MSSFFEFTYGKYESLRCSNAQRVCLPILPSTQTIFKSSLGPGDLQQGALNVMAGKNSASSALLNLVQQSLGSELSTFAGSMVQSDKMEGTSINDYKIPDISFRSFM